MTTHLADSDWVIDYIRHREDAVRLLRPLLAQRELAISAISYGEINEGILGRPGSETQINAFQDFIASVEVISVDRPVAEVYAGLRLQLRVRGELLADNDTWIAATALHHDLVLLACDGHFNRITDLRRA